MIALFALGVIGWWLDHKLLACGAWYLATASGVGRIINRRQRKRRVL